MASFIAAGLLGLLLLFPARGAAELVDRVAAVVNDQVITLSEVNAEAGPLLQNLSGDAAATAEHVQQVREEVLSLLIERRLAEQQAEKLGISVGEEEVDRGVAMVLEKNRVSREELEKGLARQGQTVAAFRDTIRGQILQSKLINFEVRSKVVVTDQKVREYFEDHFSAEKVPEGYWILQLGIVWDEAAGPEAKQEARARAEELRQEILTGEMGFREYAKMYSDLPSARDGGDLGRLKHGEMAGYMADMVRTLKPGEVSPVVETSAGFQLFKLLSFRDGEKVAPPAFESIREEIRDLVYQEESQKLYGKWVQELRDHSYIKILL